jgi:phosphoglycerol transferase
VPFHYTGDALLHSMFIKTIVNDGGYLQNPSLGAPGGMQLYDFPGVDNSAAVIIAAIGLFTKDPFLILNLFFLLTFPLVTISALFVFRQLGLSYPTSLCGSLLFTFLPYHFMRIHHLFLAAYYFIPLVVLVLLWIASGQLSDEQKRFGINLRDPKFIAAVVICVFVGSNGIYYPFFACFFFLVAGTSGAIVRRSVKPLAVAIVLVAVTFVVLIINVAPSLVYIYKHGDAGVTHRSVAGPENYSLKISQLLLPITGHRVGRFNELKNLYNRNTIVTENDAAALGLVGSIGFLFLLAQIFYRGRSQSSTLPDLSILNLFAVLLATIGGFGSLFALFVSAAIRSYNRISVFIGFFSLLAVAIGIEWLYQRTRSRAGRIGFYVLLSVVTAAAILDQTTRGYVPQYEQTKAEFLSDAAFMGTVETSLPQGAMVFQLPYVPFPENPPVNKMVDYDHLRGYLQSRKLRWSYGAMKNRPGDLWEREIAALPIGEMMQSLALAGFSGVYVDRKGYTEDETAAIEAQLRETLQIGPVVSENGRLLFFKLTDYTQRLRQKYSESEWQVKQEQALHPLILVWGKGCWDLESSPEKNWRWCTSDGELRIHNASQQTRRVTLDMAFVSGYEQFDDLIISGLISEQLKTNASPVAWSKTISVPPGESVIKFHSTGRRIDAPLDPRVLVFRIENFKLTVLE